MFQTAIVVAEVERRKKDTPTRVSRFVECSTRDDTDRLHDIYKDTVKGTEVRAIFIHVLKYPHTVFNYPYSVLELSSYSSGTIFIQFWNYLHTVLELPLYSSGMILIQVWNYLHTFLELSSYISGTILIQFWNYLHTFLELSSYSSGIIFVKL